MIRKRPCKHPGCTVLTTGAYCDQHQPKQTYVNEFIHMYGKKWRAASKQFLVAHDSCVECAKQGIYTPATEVDHITAHKGNMALFWDRKNWQALCASCHSKKTAKERQQK